MSMLLADRAQMCYCPGCSHSPILERLAAALQRNNRAPSDVCVVTDIGCIGTADRYFDCHTFHGLHGRSITYAEGIKRARPELTVIVLIGDGGCGIGTAHLVHAARRNADITVVVANNFNFGMTGGQQSPTTPEDAWTLTTPADRAETPFDLCRTAAVSGAAFVARCSALEDRATDYLEAAIRTPGFAIVDLWELCVAYFVPFNKLNPKKLSELSDRLQMPFGVFQNNPATLNAALTREKRPPKKTPINSTISLPWPGRREICIAGSAGQRIRSAAGTIGEIAVASGLFAAQQDDFPITVRKGHSISNLIIDTQPIEYTGVDRPDLVVLLSQEGADRAKIQDCVHDGSRLMTDAQIRLPETSATKTTFSLHDIERQAGRNTAALAALTQGLIATGWIAPERLLASAEASLHGPYRDENLTAIRIAVDSAKVVADSRRSPTQPQGAVS
ncbi:MAG TPA: thiamine pyrophosphate-dependent enzyme [Phycisphaerae bacterium]|nr:thiamine pyrophosphate-dependent enzyme [Phycisphaerae bacterium]